MTSELTQSEKASKEKPKAKKKRKGPSRLFYLITGIIIGVGLVIWLIFYLQSVTKTKVTYEKLSESSYQSCDFISVRREILIKGSYQHQFLIQNVIPMLERHHAIIYDATVLVKAGIPLCELGAGDLKFFVEEKKKSLYIHLPEPKIIDIGINPENIKVTKESIGLLIGHDVSKELLRMFDRIKQEINNKLDKRDVLEDARAKAQAHFKMMFASSGIDEIVFDVPRLPHREKAAPEISITSDSTSSQPKGPEVIELRDFDDRISDMENPNKNDAGGFIE